MPRRHRSDSTAFKRQVVAEYHAGETLHGPGRRHDVSRNLIRIRIEKAEAGALDEDSAAAAELISDCKARIAALERLVGRRALEIEFPKGGPRSKRSLKSTSPSATVDPPISRSNGGASRWVFRDPVSMPNPSAGPQMR